MSAATDPPAGVSRGSLRGIEDAIRDLQTSGSAATIADGADVNAGAVADAAVAAGAAGTLAAKVRGLSRDVGALTETAPATDTASSGLNGRLQRIAQNITTMISSLLTVVGAAAHDAAVSGNPVRIAGRARSTNVTAVASNDVADLVTTLIGALINKPYSIPEADIISSYGNPITFTTSDQEVYAAPAAGLRNYITELTVNVKVDFTTNTIRLRSASTATIFQLDLPNLVAGIYHFTFPTPLKCNVAEALNAVAVNAVTGTAKIMVAGYVGP